MESEQWALAGVIVGAVLGGFAQVLAGWIQGRRERKRESQRIKRKIYVAFVNAITDHTVQVGQALAARSMNASRVHLQTQTGETESLACLTKAHAAVLLYGSPEVQRTAGQFRLFLNRASDETFPLPSGSNEEVLAAISEGVAHALREAPRHHVEVLRAMRSDLDSPGEIVPLDLLKVAVREVSQNAHP